MWICLPRSYIVLRNHWREYYLWSEGLFLWWNGQCMRTGRMYRVYHEPKVVPWRFQDNRRRERKSTIRRTETKNIYCQSFNPKTKDPNLRLSYISLGFKQLVCCPKINLNTSQQQTRRDDHHCDSPSPFDYYRCSENLCNEIRINSLIG